VRHFRPWLLVISLTVLLSGSALADSVTMNFLGPGGNNSGGVYTYPYMFSIDGGAPTALLCDTFDNDVMSGETWTATVSGLLSGNGLFGDQLLNYKAAGLIFNGIVAGTIDPNQGNWAIWGLFSSNPQSNPFFQSSGAAGLESQYLGLAANADDSEFAGLFLFTPKDGSQSWGGTPQEYIGRCSVPEPSEAGMLLVLGLMACGGFTFRKRLGMPLAR
jgi:hypothetical protein